MLMAGRAQPFKALHKQLVLLGERNGSRDPKSRPGAPGPTADRAQLS